MKACWATNTALEINAYYERLDLNDVNVKRARDMGIKFAIGTDAHHPEDLNSLQLGLGVARRGWLEKKDVLNCLSVDEILRLKDQP